MDIRIKEWVKLKYVDPVLALPKLRQIQIELSQSDLDPKIKTLRTHTLKPHLEKRTAAIFCFGISCLLKTKVFIASAPRQNLDYDAVAMYFKEDLPCYVPLQIKEVVPLKMNKESSLNKTIDGLRKYTDSKETAVVIQDNRTGEFKLKDILIPPNLKIQALWILGNCLLDQSEWFLAGDLLDKNPQIYKFPYPR